MSRRTRSSRPRRNPARSSRAPTACAISEDSELGVGEAGKRHPEDSVSQRAHELGCDLERETCLSGAAGTGEGEKARAVRKQPDELFQLTLAPEERARGDRQVGGVERSERREVAVAELVQAFGTSQVLQTVLSELAERGVGIQEAAGRLGEHDLPAVGSRGDPRRAMDVDADVALVGHDRLARVQTHPNNDRAVFEGVPRFRGSRNCIGGARKRDEEGIPLSVDLDARVPRECVPQYPSVLGEQVGIGCPMLLEEPRRALDIGEEEGDGSAREVAHGSILELAPPRSLPLESDYRRRYTH